MMIQLIAKGLIAALSFGCPPPHHTITIPEEYPWEFNAQGGDQINQIMAPVLIDGMTPDERCDLIGGHIRQDEYSTLIFCDDVDF